MQDRDRLCPLHPVALPVPHGHPTQKAAPVPRRPEVPLPSSLSPESSLVYCRGRGKSKFGQSTVRRDFICGFDWCCWGGDRCSNPPPLCWVPSPPPRRGRTAAWGRGAGRERRAEPRRWPRQHPGGTRGRRPLSRLQRSRAGGRRRQSRYLFSSSCRKVQPEAGEPFN